MTNYKNAARFAAYLHEGQKYGVYPYTYHLAAVVDVLEEFGFNAPALQAAGWLHDAVEDTWISAEGIHGVFDAEVARLVEAVTNEPGKNRKERNARTYPKLRAAGTDAVALKLADRIANARQCELDDGRVGGAYVTEYPEFKNALYRNEEALEPMWAELDRLLLQ